MAAATEVPLVAAPGHSKAALGRDAVGFSVEIRDKLVFISRNPYEEAQQRRFLVVFAEAFEELRVGEDGAPPRADKGGAREGGRLRREANEYLPEEVFVVKRFVWHCRTLRPRPLGIHTRRTLIGILPENNKCG